MSDQERFTVARGDFPEGFLFATATSAYQIEGHRFGGAGQTHWDTFAREPGRVARGEDGATACDHYHRWEADLDLVSRAGFDAYRFSTSWARVMPDGVNVNPEGLDFYDRLVDGMLARGIRPMATLYHWELPEALSAKGGWTVRETPQRLADFADLIGKRLGDRLHSTAPVNEPWCVAWLSHYLAYHAPGLNDIGAAAKAMHHVALAHGLAVEALRARDVPNLGAACNLEHVIPATDAEADHAAAERYDGLYNRWFPGAMMQGAYPEDVLEGLAPHMPDGWEADMGVIAAPLDWFGVNYYTCTRIGAGSGGWPSLAAHPGPLPKTEMGWEIHPEGLGALLSRLARDYTGETPLFVTENGLASPDADPNRPDRERIAYIDLHLRETLRQIEAGIPLVGYTIWSLLDNFEWTLGYEKRFGLVHVDFDTLDRTPKASYRALEPVLARS